MLSPRVRRLKLDYELLSTRFRGWPLIQITGTAGMPPEVYRFTYHLRGLYVSATGDILERDEHVLEVNLSLGYPRRPPHCRMITPIFHPNFDASSVCIGDFWAASEGLDDLIVRIGRMVAYQEYNTKSPLNGLAAKWAAQHTGLLPVDAREIAPPSLDTTQPTASLTAPLAAAPAQSQPLPASPTALQPLSAAPTERQPLAAGLTERQPLAPAPTQPPPLAAAPTQSQPLDTSATERRPLAPAPTQSQPSPDAHDPWGEKIIIG